MDKREDTPKFDPTIGENRFGEFNKTYILHTQTFMEPTWSKSQKIKFL